MIAGVALRLLREFARGGAPLALLLACGCTIMMCDGGGPLREDQLGEWAGLRQSSPPTTKALAANANELMAVKNRVFAGKFSIPADLPIFAFNCGMVYEVPFTPAPGLIVKGEMNLLWSLLVPGRQDGRWLFFHPKRSEGRRFYVVEREWGWLLFGTDAANAYDVGTGRLVAAQRTDEVGGLGLGWMRVRRVLPVGRSGEPGLDGIVSPNLPFENIRYDLRDASILLLGLVGWGRVNHTRYIQLMWVPIPVGQAGG